MTEDDLRRLIGRVKNGSLSRRGFVKRLAAVGLTAPMATQLLAITGAAPAAAQSVPAYRPTRRGGGGALKVLYWQASTLLNPHFAVGTTNQDSSRVFYEPLAGWAADGTLHPILAAEIPSIENGGLRADGRAVTWKLKRGVKWHDGQDFSADDVVFNWEYARNPAVAAVTSGSYRDVNVVKVDDFTVRVEFAQPTPFWADAFVAATGQLIPRHLFRDFAGANSRDAPTNLRPVGTSAYRFVSFAPGDTLRAELNPNYHMDNRPYFDTLEVKGGGDAVSAARAVMQTGDYDYAWNLQVEDEILQRLEAGGRGRVNIVEGGGIEFIQLNATDPSREVDGERSSITTQHPAFTDPAVREAMSLLLDRGSIERFIYGRGGPATANFLNNPPRFRSPNMRWEFNIAKANEILDRAGWVRGRDGIRAKNNVRLRFIYQTSVNAPRQRTQAIYKQAAQRAGIDLELKSVTASVFFSSEVLRRRADVHDHHAAGGSRAVHEPVRVVGDLLAREFLAGPQHRPLAQRGIRPDLPRGTGRAGPGQARRDVHPAERPDRGQQPHHSRGGTPHRQRQPEQPAPRAERVGRHLLAAERLVARDLTVRACSST